MSALKSKNSDAQLRVIIVINVIILGLLFKVLWDNILSPDVAAANPGWIVSCQYSHSSKDDPIVSPGRTDAAHLHDFTGARNTDAFSTSATLKTGGSTCAIPGDTTAYWVPAMYKNGIRVLPNGTGKHTLFYYRRIAAPSGMTVRNIPDGLRMIVGNANAKSPSENTAITRGNIIFKCGPGSTTDLSAPPQQCGSGIMVVSYRFPNCWNGRDLDSPDHLSHMSYPISGKCPSTHPVVIPRIESFFRYNVGTAPIGTITFSSGPFFTAHQDVLAAWKDTTIQFLMDKCINAGVDCGTNPSAP